ncbi:MAG: RluA family pseudouridine synthase [Dehalococcoidia bacterium]
MGRTVELRADREGERLDLFVARQRPELSRSRVQRLIEQGLVTIEGRPARAGLRLERGRRVCLTVPPPEPLELAPEAIPLSVVYEDEDLLVVDKPAGMAVHPGPGHSAHTLVNAVLARCPDLRGVGGQGRPGIVHRLDKDTSGLIIVARNDLAHLSLSRQLKERRVEKGYLALVHGHVEPPEGVIEAPIGRDPRHRQRMAVVEGGREARTGYRVARYVDSYTLVEVTPHTGRTHQIRVHFAALGYPVVGDGVYGRPCPVLGRQFLHAFRLAFRHPRTGEALRLEAPLPADLRAAMRRLAAG